jgi:hypothetical protein
MTATRYNLRIPILADLGTGQHGIITASILAGEHGATDVHGRLVGHRPGARTDRCPRCQDELQQARERA